MTTPEPTTEPTQATTGASPQAVDTPPAPPTQEPAEAPPAADDEPSDKSEAAKYRRRLRDTETERDGLAERLATLQRAEAERLAADVLAAGPDLWLSGTELSDLLDDTGNIDHAKVTAAAQSVAAERPHWGRKSPAAAAAGEVTGNGKIYGGDEPRGWAAVLSGQPAK